VWGQPPIRKPRNNQTKEVKDLHRESYKTVKKEIEGPGKWKDHPCSWITKIF
jgi:hypothetical protein